MQPLQPELSVPAWHSLPVDEVLRAVESSAQRLSMDFDGGGAAATGETVFERKWV